MLRIDRFVYLFAALLLLILPLNWLMAAFTAALFHELCHILVLFLLGGQILGIKISTGGAVIETSQMNRGRELLCALAGPLGSVLLLFLCRWFPRVAVCAGVQAMYNLLPVYPLDGGRILRCGAGLVFSQAQVDSICKWAEWTAVFCMAALSFVAAFIWHLGVFPLVLAVILVIKKNSLQSSTIRGTMDVTFVKR